MDKDTKKSIKRSMKHYDSMIKDTERLVKDNPDYDLDNFIKHLKHQRGMIASQIGKTNKKK